MQSPSFAENTAHVYAQYKLFLLGLFGLIMLFAGGFLYSSYYEKKNWVRTMGTVTEAVCRPYVQHTQYRSDTKYMCQLEISHAHNKKKYTSTLMTDSMLPHKKGDKIDIKVDPSLPENIVLTSSIPSWGLSTFIIVCGLLSLVIAWQAFVYCSKHSCSALGGILAFTDFTDAIRGRR